MARSRSSAAGSQAKGREVAEAIATLRKML